MDREPTGQPEGLLERLGNACWLYPWRVLSLWFVAVLAAGLFVAHNPTRLLSGSGDLAGSMSARVGEILAHNFEGGEAQSLVLAFRRQSTNEAADDWQTVSDRLADAISAAPGVEQVSTADWLIDPPDSTNGFQYGALILSLGGLDTLAQEQRIEPLRQAAGAAVRTLGADGRGIEWALTGRAAISHDINVFSNRDTAQAELRALPLAFAVLLYAFGSLAAAGLPLALAVCARTVGLAGIVAITVIADVSNLAQSIVTMISLALGIDYSLFVYHRFRELLAGGCEAGEALRGAMSQSGQVVLYSGLAVAIGMGSLLATGSLQVRSIGLAGAIAVVASVAAALTLLPALLAIMPRRLRQGNEAKLREADPSFRWRRWGGMVVRRPWLAIAGSVALLALLIAPVAETRFGFPEDDFLPAKLDSVRGLTMLEEAGLKGLVSPLFVLISDNQGERLINPQRVSVLVALIDRLERDPRIKLVQAPSMRTGPSALPLPIDPNRGTVSRDGTQIVLRVIPASGIGLADVRALARQLQQERVPRAQVLIGGQAQYFNDFQDEMVTSFPRILILVLTLSALVLLAMLRAPLAVAKAIALNLLSVAAGYGMVVLVFQLGHGAWLFGLPAPAEVVTPSVPIVIFAVLFGLSMDYEIFLISRIRTLYLQGSDNNTAIIDALADTGAVITQAAAIMAIVFGAFAFSGFLLLQMIGLGLAVAIITDAVLIRSILGPAVMALAGKWNWWPHTIGR